MRLRCSWSQPRAICWMFMIPLTALCCAGSVPETGGAPLHGKHMASLFLKGAATVCAERHTRLELLNKLCSESTISYLKFFSLSILKYSLCNEPLIELSNPGASGSIFYVSSDDEFIIKTVQHKEAEFLQKLLPGYFMVSLRSENRNLKSPGVTCVIYL